jgi:serine/threonine protein kinase
MRIAGAVSLRLAAHPGGGILEGSFWMPGPGSAPPSGSFDPSSTVAAVDELGAYEVISQLDCGPVTTSYLCRKSGKTGGDEPYVLSVVHEELRMHRWLVEQLLTETAKCAAIRHPNVEAIVDFGTIRERTFVVTRYIDGCSLSQLLSQPGEMPYRIALPLLVDVLRGLHAAHTQRDPAGNRDPIVHSGVSPATILVGRDGIARIAEFGIARVQMRTTQTMPGVRHDRFAHLAPEQIGDVHELGPWPTSGGGYPVLWSVLTRLPLFGAAIRRHDDRVLHVTVPCQRRAPRPHGSTTSRSRSTESGTNVTRAPDTWRSPLRQSDQHDRWAPAPRSRRSAAPDQLTQPRPRHFDRAARALCDSPVVRHELAAGRSKARRPMRPDARNEARSCWLFGRRDRIAGRPRDCAAPERRTLRRTAGANPRGPNVAPPLIPCRAPPSSRRGSRPVSGGGAASTEAMPPVRVVPAAPNFVHPNLEGGASRPPARSQSASRDARGTTAERVGRRTGAVGNSASDFAAEHRAQSVHAPLTPTHRAVIGPRSREARPAR